MKLKNLKPAPGEGRGVTLGVVLSFFLHPVAIIAVALVGSAIESGGGLIALPFLAFIGATEWIYLLPAAWLLRRRGKAAIAKGVLIGGSLVLLLCTLCYGGI